VSAPRKAHAHPAASADAARELFARHGWGGSWVDGVFGFHHFHSTSHEALAVVAGRATLELGGPQGEAFDAGEARERIEKKRSGLVAEIERAEKKLENEQFVAKAPAAVVDEERRKLEEYREALAQLEQ